MLLTALLVLVRADVVLEAVGVAFLTAGRDAGDEEARDSTLGLKNPNSVD